MTIKENLRSLPTRIPMGFRSRWPMKMFYEESKYSQWILWRLTNFIVRINRRFPWYIECCCIVVQSLDLQWAQKQKKIYFQDVCRCPLFLKRVFLWQILDAVVHVHVQYVTAQMFVISRKYKKHFCLCKIKICKEMKIFFPKIKPNSV